MRPIVRPTRCAVRSDILRATKLSELRAPRSARFLNARSFGPATQEFLHDGLPVAALAEQTLDELAACALSAARLELPRRGRENFRRCVRGSNRNRCARHGREVREIVPRVKNLIEFNAKFFRDTLRLFEFVRRTLVQ